MWHPLLVHKRTPYIIDVPKGYSRQAQKRSLLDIILLSNYATLVLQCTNFEPLMVLVCVRSALFKCIAPGRVLLVSSGPPAPEAGHQVSAPHYCERMFGFSAIVLLCPPSTLLLLLHLRVLGVSWLTHPNI